MDIEDRIRARLEGILEEAKRRADSEETACGCSSLERDLNEEERNLYHQTINAYRGAVNVVNHRSQENLSFMSILSRIIESIREKEDLQEICSRIADCVLQDLGVEYCGIIFFRGPRQTECPFSVEGVREERKFLRIHSNSGMLRSEEFEETVASLALESPDFVNIEDVCLDARFSRIDLPSIVRSLVCVPIALNRMTVGALVLSHSQPFFFKPSLIRVLKILGNTISHLRLLTSKRSAQTAGTEPASPVSSRGRHSRDVISIVLLDFELADSFGRDLAVDKTILRSIRTALESTLESGESLLFQGGAELLALLPGVSAEQLLHRVTRMCEEFDQWKKDQKAVLQNARLSLGFSTCEEGQNLVQALEIASLMMHPEPDEGAFLSAQAK